MIFVGYPLITTLLLPFESIGIEFTRLITIPYRVFTLLLALFTLILHLYNKVNLQWCGRLLIIYWLALLMRIFYDLNLRDDFPVIFDEKVYIWTFSLGVCFIPMVSVFKSYNSINFKLGLKTIFYLYGIILSIILITNHENLFSETNRLNANAAFSSIAFGHFGVSGILLSMSYYKKEKIVSLYTFFLSLFFMLQAGSRGPLITFIVLLLFIYISKKRNFKSIIILFIVLALGILLLGSYLITFFSQIAPVLYNRVFFQTFDGEEDGREPLFSEAYNSFLNNPILGDKFALNLNGLTLYSHNIILDSLMGLGIIGGIIMIILIIKTTILAYQSSRNNEFILKLLLLQQIISLMLSSAIYLNPLVNILWVISLIKPSKHNTTL